LDDGGIIVAICAMLLVIGFIYIFAMLSLAKKMRLIQHHASGGSVTPINKPLEIKTCPHCKRVLADEFGFCPGCGTDFNDV